MYKPKAGTLAEVFMTEEKQKHGGKRPGAGNKRKMPEGSPTFCIRVPEELHTALVAANPDEVRKVLTERFCAPPVVKQP